MRRAMVPWHPHTLIEKPGAQVGGTRVNAASSRSHCVCSAVVESRVVEGGVTNLRTSRLHLVDLAGAHLHLANTASSL